MFRVLLAAILLFCVVIEAANTNVFVNPPPAQGHFDLSGNPEYKLGDSVHLQWVTNFKNSNLVFRQLNATTGKAIESGSAFVKKGLNSSQNSLDWTVITFNTNLGLSNVYYFMVVDASAGGTNDESSASRIRVNNQTQFASHWFNVTRNTGSPSSGNGNTNQDQDKLGYEAKVGIGVGVGVGCALLIALGAAIWYLRRRIKAIGGRSQATEESHPPAEDNASKPPVPESEPVAYEKDSDRQPQPPPAEVHSNTLVEMPAERGVELPNQQQEVRYELP